MAEPGSVSKKIMRGGKNETSQAKPFSTRSTSMKDVLIRTKTMLHAWTSDCRKMTAQLPMTALPTQQPSPSRLNFPIQWW